ncbi:MAG: lytic murein transglycosylase [Roseiarcus sp.]|jgi:peptidoglycan lytic transglycosylase B
MTERDEQAPAGAGARTGPSRRAFLTTACAAGLAPRSATALAASGSKAAAREPGAFDRFIESLWPKAQARGVSRETFDSAFRGVTFDPRVIAHTENQAEFVRPIWDYLAAAVSDRRVARARAVAEEYRPWLAKARDAYGVDPAVLIGIWGLETEFGAFVGSDYVIRALGSLAYVGFQAEYFCDELLAALQILEDGDIKPAGMIGSWAGAMGQTQFMPSSFRRFAVDFDHGGRRDIWTSAPDAIGSTANYLAGHGWIAGAPWGFEVFLPEGFVLEAADCARFVPFRAFAARGVARVDREALPDSGEAELLITAGLDAPIFLVTPNFFVIKSYNDATAYALGVALLGDRAMGGEGLRAAWPVHDRQLSVGQMREMQTRLGRMGYDAGKVDGKIGDSGRAALRAYQEKTGQTPDGYPTLALLLQMRK